MPRVYHKSAKMTRRAAGNALLTAAHPRRPLMAFQGSSFCAIITSLALLRHHARVLLTQTAVHTSVARATGLNWHTSRFLHQIDILLAFSNEAHLQI